MSRLCVILFGPPGSGKGTQAKFLKQALGIAHISTGDMLREHMAAGDGLGHEIAATIQAGGLVPDETVNLMVEERIELPDCKDGVYSGRFSADREPGQTVGGPAGGAWDPASGGSPQS
jgi:adenylate kinase